MSDKQRLRIAGIGLVLAVIAGFALTAALYNRAFANPAEITVVTERAGLVMDPGNKVKLRGVEIGRVGAVNRVGDRVELTLEIDRDAMSGIPEDVGAEIRATTVFGAKYVELVPPAKPATTAIAIGARIDASGITTEVNTVFDGLDRLLSGIDITDLNTTLSVLSETLSGRGEQISEVAARANGYLTKLEPLLPQLRRDLLAVAESARLGVKVSPALISILRNTTVTAETVTDNEKALDTLLVNLSLLGGKGAEVLGVNAEALSALLHGLRPTASTLRVYSSELPCLLKGLDNTRKIMAKVIGGTDATLRGWVSVRSKMSKYTAPKDLPGLSQPGQADCHGLPMLSGSQIPIPERGTPE